MAIRPFIPGTQPSASHLNELVDACNLILNVRGGSLIAVNRNTGGITVDLNLGMLMERIGHRTPGEMPDGSANYDLLYWLTTDSDWHLLAFTATAYKVLQRAAGGTLIWDWVRSH